MKGLIRRADVMGKITAADKQNSYRQMSGAEVYTEMLSALQDAEDVDAVEVVYGNWIPAESDFDDDDALFDVEEWSDWQCSACREDICYDDPMERRFLPRFCPNCGAKMDGGADNASD